MRVDIASDLGNILVPGNDGFKEFHEGTRAEYGERTKGIIIQKSI